MPDATRKHVHEEVFDASAGDLFAALHTPSAIRAWWSAARAIVMPEAGGLWVAAWGEDEPDYITVATMRTFDPPHRIVMDDYHYHTKTGGLPFEADFVVEFAVEPHPEGALLRVTQDGFPSTTEADAFYDACGIGWINTFAGIRRFFEGAVRSC